MKKSVDNIQKMTLFAFQDTILFRDTQDKIAEEWLFDKRGSCETK